MSLFLTKLFSKRSNIEFVLGTFSRPKWVIFLASIAVFIITVFILLFSLNHNVLVGVPAYGGTDVEGVIGTPRFINPLLALSEADKDLSAIVYAGLMRRDTDGNIVPYLAENYTVSEDGLTYTFTIKDKALFHDGKKVTAEDVVFTINEAKDPLIKSPKKVNWDGVTVSATDERTVVFTLKQRYASFLDNTTIGILPAHLWKNISAEQFGLSNLNTKPIGSGPFQVSKVKEDGAGIPLSYELKPFSKFIFEKPYLNKIIFRFYANESDLINALRGGDVSAINSISTDQAKLLEKQGYKLKTTILPRVFGLYLDPSQNKLFADVTVVSALEFAFSKKQIVSKVLNGYGTPIDSPIPPLLLGRTPGANIVDQDLEKAASWLTKAGWTKSEAGFWQKKSGSGSKASTTNLSFDISTSDTPELKDAANQIKDELNAFGAQVDVKVFEMGALNQNVIRPRKFEALFFGQIINHDTDLFAFWHSSQRNDPGLNIAQYASVRADKDLENAGGTLDKEKRVEFYEAFESEVMKDMPAIFVYSPAFIYVTNGSIKNNDVHNITMANDRFAEIWKWYQNEDRVWPVFAKDSK